MVNHDANPLPCGWSLQRTLTLSSLFPPASLLQQKSHIMSGTSSCTINASQLLYMLSHPHTCRTRDGMVQGWNHNRINPVFFAHTMSTLPPPSPPPYLRACTGALLGMGNPLLDISAVVDAEFLGKYVLVHVGCLGPQCFCPALVLSRQFPRKSPHVIPRCVFRQARPYTGHLYIC